MTNWLFTNRQTHDDDDDDHEHYLHQQPGDDCEVMRHYHNIGETSQPTALTNSDIRGLITKILLAHIATGSRGSFPAHICVFELSVTILWHVSPRSDGIVLIRGSWGFQSREMWFYFMNMKI